MFNTVANPSIFLSLLTLFYSGSSLSAATPTIVPTSTYLTIISAKSEDLKLTPSRYPLIKDFTEKN